MQINEKLHLVIPVEIEPGAVVKDAAGKETYVPGKTVYVHSAPISHDLYKRYFIAISKAFAEVMAQGAPALALRNASLWLEKVAADMGQWDTDGGVRDGLLAEVKRLTNVLVPSPQGWTTIPFQQATEILGEEDTAEVENAVIFFTLALWSLRKRERREMLETAATLLGGLITSSGFTAYRDSLPTSNVTVSSGEPTTGSSPAY